MKSTAKEKVVYISPKCREINVEPSSLICTSNPTGRSTERYEDGNTDGWFN